MDKVLVLKRILYRAHYRGGKEADCILSSFAAQLSQLNNDQDLLDFDGLLERDDSDIFSWIENLEPVPAAYDTPVLDQLRAYYQKLSRGISI